MRENLSKIELLAPAGSWERLRAAIHAGCDAVYAGGVKFGARAYAGNFNKDELLQAMDYVHLHGKKLYLTVNTLLKNRELKEELYDYLVPYYEGGVDAVIVQDIGVLKFIHENFPDLPIHGSTQMTAVMDGGLEVLKEMGLTRIVLSRELDLFETKELSSRSGLEIESFVHGALCYCYSGQCLMSSMIGGRSGNRGKCAQPCRMPYQVQNTELNIDRTNQYIMSPKDLCTLELIPELQRAGIHSFKIEGRMKSAEYTALTVSKYRKYLDLYYELGDVLYSNYIEENQALLERDILEISDIYNRGNFTKGYFIKHNGRDMMTMSRPNHNGVKIGTVTGIKGNQAFILLNEDVNAQDVLEIRGNKENTYEFTRKADEIRGETIKTNFYQGMKLTIGQEVYRIRNQYLMDRVKTEFIDNKKYIGIHADFLAVIGENMQLSLEKDGITAAICGKVAEEAKNQPTAKSKIISQLNKTKDTDFYLESLDIKADHNVFIPAASLNDLRRKALEELKEAMLKPYRRVPLGKVKNTENLNILAKVSNNVNSTCHNYEGRLIVQVANKSHLKQVLLFQETGAIYFDLSELPFEEIPDVIHMVREKGKEIYFVLPYIFRKEVFDQFQNNLSYFMSSQINGFVIRNMEEYSFLLNQVKSFEYGHKIILDYNMYTMNQEAGQFWKDRGIWELTAPMELNYKELKEKRLNDSQIIVYGNVPLMISAQCIVKNMKGCTKVTTRTELTEGRGRKFFAYNHCRCCYNLIYNGQPISLLSRSKEVLSLEPKGFRIIFTWESNARIEKIMQQFIRAFQYKNDGINDLDDYTKGHFHRGIE